LIVKRVDRVGDAVDDRFDRVRAGKQEEQLSDEKADFEKKFVEKIRPAVEPLVQDI
jgi:hypothetical protein